MKLIKGFSKIILFATLGCSFVLASCERDENKVNTDCIELANNVTTTGNAYASDLSVTNCNAYQAALEAYISGCNTTVDVSSFQTTLRELECE
jgi:hypothetical protein